jgi:hypothetical protein
MLVLHVPNALQDTSTDGIAQILSRRLWMDVPKIHRPVQTLRASHSIAREGRVGCERRACKRTWLSDWGQCRRLCDERLGRGGLSSLSSCLLGLGNVRTAIFTVIDALASPCRFCGKGVDNLEPLLVNSHSPYIHTN